VYAIGRVARQIGASGFYAHVSVECRAPLGALGPPACALDDDSVPRSWRSAAISGAAWALDIANARVICRITTIQGMARDTNPTLMAIAAARAIWTAVEFKPGDALLAKVEQAISSSHGIPEGELGLPCFVDQNDE
jgi:hypothetical protein